MFVLAHVHLYKYYGPVMFRNREIYKNKANFKMAAEDDLEKNVTNSNFVS